MLTFSRFIQENWNEKLHPRISRGHKGGGRFTNKYLHYAPTKVSKVNPGPEQSTNEMKPRGLWVSVGSEWADWAKAEKFGVERLKEKTTVVLKKHAKILRISTAEELDNFTAKYRGDDKKFPMINWKKVAAKYQGIVIAPYIWSRRMTNHTMWYYGWDVASGCVWDPNAIKEIK